MLKPLSRWNGLAAEAQNTIGQIRESTQIGESQLSRMTSEVELTLDAIRDAAFIVTLVVVVVGGLAAGLLARQIR
jgi:hypothetical protein